MAIYLLVAGIEGSSTEEKHVGWIPIKTCEFPVERPGVNTRPGKVTDRLRSGVTFPQITCGKECDKASFALMKWMVDGTSLEVKIAFCKEKGEEIFLITLTETICTKFSTSCSGDDQPTESISLDFTQIVMGYTTYNKAGKEPKTLTVGYDLEKAKSM